MFRCENCGVVVPSGTKVKVAMKGVRVREYPPQPVPARGKSKRRKPRWGRAGLGWEPEERLRVCGVCYPALKEAHDVELAQKLGNARELLRASQAAAEAAAQDEDDRGY